MTVLEKIKSSRLFFDGGMGTLLQERGLLPGELPEEWNVAHADIIVDIHAAYLRAGARILKTNTFGANRLKLDAVAEVIASAVSNARAARTACADIDDDVYIALDVGPLGKMLEPLGDVSFEDAVSIFGEVMRAGASCGVDLILIETMNDSYETKAAVLAAKEETNLPVFVTNAYDEKGHLLTGATPSAMVSLLEGLGVDALGVNCSLGPRQLRPIVETLLKEASVPVIVNPNAGLPREENGKTVFDVDADSFAADMEEMATLGVTLLGGCCGTTPTYIQKSVERVKNCPFERPHVKKRTVISSHARAVFFGGAPVLIGERINPTGKKKFKEALLSSDFDYIIGEGLAEEASGAHVLDVNVGLPGIDETAVMTRVLQDLQALTPLPLQIDTSNVQTMAKAMRLYNGKPLVNSVNGKQESMEAIFPLVAKYGGVLVGLTLDEQGIPQSAEGRLVIAEKIVKTAATYGISKEDIIIDPLAMAVSADPYSAQDTLRAIRLIKEKLGVCTSLGVSNISFGLPNREALNATFFSMALSEGLSAAIMNPHSVSMMRTYRTACALLGQDENFSSYIAMTTADEQVGAEQASSAEKSPLRQAIVKGMRERAAECTEQLLATMPALDVISSEIVPALDEVGQGFEKQTVYLPQLLLSAEAAKASFDAVRRQMERDGAPRRTDSRIVLATVKGDIHDIGKNIVKVLLDNYGFEVIDLGKDVPPEAVCEAVLRHGVRLVGLSALMTTTVPAMAETVRQLKNCAPDTKIMVGGAVLTEDYAMKIGADFYGGDAMQSVRYAERVFKERA